ncbi:MAG TPA: hypothetical protein PK156_00710 [Polyangium sp.]|nr:hypothetical protein [Polyangium sp.]
MKHRLGFVIAVGVGLLGQASALAQQPAPPAPPAPPPSAAPAPQPPENSAPTPAAPPSDKPAEAPVDSVAGQTDPNTLPAPKATESTPNAPPTPPPAGSVAPAPAVPAPITLPPYLTGGPAPITILPPISAPDTITPPPPTSETQTDPSKRKKGDAYVRWRGSGISWNHAVSTTALGVGADYISSANQQYTQGLSGTFNYFLIDSYEPSGRKRGYYVRVATTLGFDVELTNSDTTTEKYEKQLRDTPISLIYSKTFYKTPDEMTVVALNTNGTIILPTSPTTYGQGVYLGVSPRATLILQLPLRGKEASFLQAIMMGLGASYTHRFSRAETPTNPDLQRLRQSTTGSLIVSDQLTGASINSNNMRIGAWGFLSEKVFGRDLWIQFGGGASYQFVNQFSAPSDNCALVVATGCASAGHLPDKLTARVVTDFGISLNYFPSAEWGIGLGYDNNTLQLAPDGTRRNPFFSPDAQFSASILVSLDAIAERLEGNVRDEPVIYFGQNRPNRKSPQNRPMQAVF